MKFQATLSRSYILLLTLTPYPSSAERLFPQIGYAKMTRVAQQPAYQAISADYRITPQLNAMVICTPKLMSTGVLSYRTNHGISSVFSYHLERRHCKTASCDVLDASLYPNKYLGVLGLYQRTPSTPWSFSAGVTHHKNHRVDAFTTTRYALAFRHNGFIPLKIQYTTTKQLDQTVDISVHWVNLCAPTQQANKQTFRRIKSNAPFSDCLLNTHTNAIEILSEHKQRIHTGALVPPPPPPSPLHSEYARNHSSLATPEHNQNRANHLLDADTIPSVKQRRSAPKYAWRMALVAAPTPNQTQTNRLDMPPISPIVQHTARPLFKQSTDLTRPKKMPDTALLHTTNTMHSPKSDAQIPKVRLGIAKAIAQQRSALISDEPCDSFLLLMESSYIEKFDSIETEITLPTNRSDSLSSFVPAPDQKSDSTTSSAASTQAYNKRPLLGSDTLNTHIIPVLLSATHRLNNQLLLFREIKSANFPIENQVNFSKFVLNSYEKQTQIILNCINHYLIETKKQITKNEQRINWFNYVEENKWIPPTLVTCSEKEATLLNASQKELTELYISLRSIFSEGVSILVGLAPFMTTKENSNFKYMLNTNHFLQACPCTHSYSNSKKNDSLKDQLEGSLYDKMLLSTTLSQFWLNQVMHVFAVERYDRSFE